MIALILKRIVMLATTAIFVAMLSFMAVYYSPGRTAELILENKIPLGGPSQEMVQQYEQELELDKSFPELFSKWIGKAVTGDFGNSFKTGSPVWDEFRDRFPFTLGLLILATMIYIPLGLVLGTLSALYQNSWLDHFVRWLSALKLSIPSFWLALLLIWLISIKLRILPSFGYKGFSSLILPALTLGLGMTAPMTRVLRTCLLEALNSPYAFTARAKGLGEPEIIIKHIMKNVLIPCLTLVGTNTVSLLGGTVIVENIFGLPGIGNYLVQAISLKDYPVICGFTFIIGMFTMVINTLVDLSYGWIDPRVRYITSVKKG